MPLYEHVYIARQDVSQQQVDAITAQFKGVIEEHGGSVGKLEYWGLRTLTYKIKKNRKGHYTLMQIDANADAVKEMERQMRFHEDILGFITLKVETHEDGPSIMLQNKGGRDDRRGGRDRDRGPRGDRGDRGGRDRDRGPRGDRDDRPPRGDRDDRPPREDRAPRASAD